MRSVMDGLTIDRDFLEGTLRDMVRINSVNPDLVPGAPGEAEIAAYLARTFEEMGLEVDVHEAVKGRPSVVGILRGGSSGRSLMLNGHIDTVGIEGMARPFSAETRDGRMYGRGAHDMKGCVAASVAAVKALIDAGVAPAGDVLLAAVSDEEYASLGTAEILEHYSCDGAVVTEPTELEICVAHKGFVWLEVTTEGTAAHGSRHDLGVDANLRMGRFLSRLETLSQELLRSREPHRRVGPPTVHAPLLSGGEGISTYSPRCTLKVERRTLPGESEAQALAELQAILDRLTAEDPEFRGSVKTILSRPPFEVAEDAGIVQSIARASAAVLGAVPPIAGQSPWMDSALLAEAGVETVVMGGSGAGEHAAEEWVDLASLARMAEILARMTVDYCR